jgi:hypothetical protein
MQRAVIDAMERTQGALMVDDLEWAWHHTKALAQSTAFMCELADTFDGLCEKSIDLVSQSERSSQRT